MRQALFDVQSSTFLSAAPLCIATWSVLSLLISVLRIIRAGVVRISLVIDIFCIHL